jgi:Holliday junction resolvasome RuvABC endonuclease subunit
MRSVGIDPSMTATGWVDYDDTVGQIVDSQLISTPADMLYVDRYKTIRDQVYRLLQTRADVVMGVESPIFGATYSPGAYALHVYVSEAIQAAGRDVVFFDPGTVKMLAKKDPKNHQGVMSKADMVRAAKADLGLGKRDKLNHNIADAYHVAKAAARFWQFYHGLIKESDLNPSEWQAFANKHTFKKGVKMGKTEYTGAVYKENERFFRFSKK